MLIPTNELAWAAGLFEGEGTIRINKPANRNWGSLVVSVVNTDRQVIDWFQLRWPGYFKPATGLREKQRPAWVWVIAATKAIAFLNSISPFVVRDIVKERIKHAIYFQSQKVKNTRSMSPDQKEQYRQDQWEAYWWMCELNTRGVRPKPACRVCGCTDDDCTQCYLCYLETGMPCTWVEAGLCSRCALKPVRMSGDTGEQPSPLNARPRAVLA